MVAMLDLQKPTIGLLRHFCPGGAKHLASGFFSPLEQCFLQFWMVESYFWRRAGEDIRPREGGFHLAIPVASPVWEIESADIIDEGFEAELNQLSHAPGMTRFAAYPIAEDCFPFDNGCGESLTLERNCS